jgi:hypothetical protein
MREDARERVQPVQSGAAKRAPPQPPCRLRILLAAPRRSAAARGAAEAVHTGNNPKP